MPHRLVRLAGSVGPPLLVFLGVLAAWDRAIVWFSIKAYVLPRPGAVALAAWADRTELIQATGRTAAAALFGFGLSLTVGTLVAMAFATSSLVRRSFYPYAIFLQTVPVVAVAPLLNLYPGPGFGSVVLLSWMISVFPIITGATTGLTRIPPEWRDLFRLYRAGPWQVLWKLRAPNAIPYLVNGAKTSSGLAVIGAVVGDMFCNSSRSGYALGYHIFQASTQTLDAAQAFAYFLTSTALALTIFLAAGGLGRLILSRMGDRSEPGTA